MRVSARAVMALAFPWRWILPPVSEAQRRWAFANKDKSGPEGKAAREYADADEGGKLPERVSDSERAKQRYGKK